MSKALQYDEWLRQNNYPIRGRNFERHTKPFTISQEAYEGLAFLAKNLVPAKFSSLNNTSNISKLLELLGQHQLTIQQIQSLDFEGTTTQECYEAGVEDAKEGRQADFRLIYPNHPREFEEAYRRGYLEGKS